jgi:arylsulfatase A-like enzyme
VLPDAPRGLRRAFVWGSLDVPEEELTDPQAVAWAERVLARQHDAPFFLACGLSRPHLPWYVPQEYFDRYPLEEVVVPTAPRDGTEGSGRWATIAEQDLEREVVGAYLACISFADAMVGRLVAAARRSPRGDDMLIVLWSDNGIHLGEKSHFGKSRLWEESTRVPLVIAGPGIEPGVCEQPVSLVDVYPTLVELCGLGFEGELDGMSLVPLLRSPDAPRTRPALTTNGAGNHAVRTERWCYIRYRDGAEELYDHDADPDQWHNLAGDPRYADVAVRLARWLPDRARTRRPDDPS